MDDWLGVFEVLGAAGAWVAALYVYRKYKEVERDIDRVLGDEHEQGYGP